MIMTEDDEPALLVAEHVKEDACLTLNGTKVIMSLLSKNEEKVSESNIWYLDNGASNHMTGFKAKFTKLDESITGQVRFGDGSTIKIEGKGTVMMKCKNGEERALHEVYYIPNLCNNIISLGQMSEDGNKVEMKGEFLWIFDKQEQLLMKVKRTPNRLYKILIETNKQTSVLANKGR